MSTNQLTSLLALTTLILLTAAVSPHQLWLRVAVS